MEEHPLIYNPSARGGMRAARRAVALLRARGIAASLVSTRAAGDAGVLAAQLAGEGHARLLVCGGDGTISEACDGLLRARLRPELGFLPAGTGNSFLLHFGLRTIAEAADRIAQAAPRDLDAARVRWPGGERHFVNVFGVGFAARVADLANRRMKWAAGAAYTLGVFPELARLRPVRTRIVVDGAEHEEDLALAFVCNTRHTGGRMLVAPMASPEDGLLDVIALRRVGRLALLKLFPRIFDGSHVGDPRVLVLRGRRIRLEPQEPSPLLADGEVFGATPAEVECLPSALRVLA